MERDSGNVYLTPEAVDPPDGHGEVGEIRLMRSSGMEKDHLLLDKFS